MAAAFLQCTSSIFCVTASKLVIGFWFSLGLVWVWSVTEEWETYTEINFSPVAECG